METRKITIVSTKTQKKYVVESNATTLGELKSVLNANNIDFSDMTFYEGLSKTELNHDDSILPHDIERNGQTTNELVFMLSNMNKKIESGALSDVRAAVYHEIQDKNLQEAVKAQFGRNFTQVPTAALVEFVETTPICNTVEKENLTLEEAFVELCKVLCDDEFISTDDFERLTSSFIKEEQPESPYTDKEICRIFNHLL
jgi:hypothetical protein